MPMLPASPSVEAAAEKLEEEELEVRETGKKPLVLSKLRHIAACSVVTWRISVWMSARYAKPLVHLKKLDKYIRMGSPVLLICWSGSVGRAADS